MEDQSWGNKGCSISGRENAVRVCFISCETSVDSSLCSATARVDTQLALQVVCSKVASGDEACSGVRRAAGSLKELGLGGVGRVETRVRPIDRRSCGRSLMRNVSIHHPRCPSFTSSVSVHAFEQRVTHRLIDVDNRVLLGFGCVRREQT